MRWTKLNPRRVRRTFALAALGAAALLAGPLATKSHAGTYAATDCSWSNTSSVASYSQSHVMGFVYQACGNGGLGLGMSIPTAGWTGPQTGATWSVSTPAGTHFSQVGMSQRGKSDPGGGWALEVYAAGPNGWTPLGAASDGASVWRGIGTATGGYYTLVSSHLTCISGSGCNGSLQAGLFIRDLLFDMVDDTPPSVDAAGELLNGDVQRGVGRIDVHAGDVGAGLTSVAVLVNNQELVQRNFACNGATSMQPCALSQQTQFDLDTQVASFHDGSNTIQACASDYGDPPNLTCTPEQVVHVDDSCAASRVPGGTDLSARFVQNGDGTVTVRSRQSATVTGRLSDRTGEPVQGAMLCVSESTLVPGEGLADVGAVKTNTEGRYRYTVAPGPNREIEIGYRYNRHQLQRDVRYFARVAPSLKLSRERVRNGGRIQLFGSLPGPDNEERIVVLQARYPGKNQRWKTFQNARTNEFGRYSATYRFLATFVTTEYRMRAVVPAQNDYPFLAGHSRRRTIRVVGGR
jgi:hypothetical protein